MQRVISRGHAAIAFALLLGVTIFTPHASGASPINGAALLVQNAGSESLAIPVLVRRGAVVRRGTYVGPRGGVARRTVVRRGAVVRPGVRWVRPGYYRWPVGGAIAAGAAVGFVTAATAAAWAGAAPAPGMCWYYKDATRTQGFWDYCPR